MDAAAWIRSRLVGFTCAACGTPFRRERIRILAQREALFFVALDCSACVSESVAIISLHATGAGPAGDRQAMGFEELTAEGARAAASDPGVRAGDVLAMHEFLGRFDGDFHGLFGGSRERPSGSAGA